MNEEFKKFLSASSGFFIGGMMGGVIAMGIYYGITSMARLTDFEFQKTCRFAGGDYVEAAGKDYCSVEVAGREVILDKDETNALAEDIIENLRKR